MATKPKSFDVIKEINANRDFLIKYFEKEWGEIQRGAKREELVSKAKAGAGAMARGMLALMMLGGVLMVAAAAPNVFSVYDKSTKYRGYYNKKQFKKSCSYLKRKNYARVNIDGKNGYKIAITERGADSLLRNLFKRFSIQKPKKWDGHWRIVIFDIPRKDNAARNAFRKKLKALGFYKLQNSVFVHPFPCDHELGFLISVFGIAPYVHVIKAKSISIENTLKKHFRLF